MSAKQRRTNASKIRSGWIVGSELGDVNEEQEWDAEVKIEMDPRNFAVEGEHGSLYSIHAFCFVLLWYTTVFCPLLSSVLKLHSDIG